MGWPCPAVAGQHRLRIRTLACIVFVRCWLLDAVVLRRYEAKDGHVRHNVTSGVAVRHADLANTSASLLRLHPYYHSTATIQQELQALAASCPQMQLTTETQGSLMGASASIEVVTIRAPGTQPRNKVFLLMGEHSRELIGPETGLFLVKSFCGQTEFSSKAQEVLTHSEFQIVVNGNPRSREKVEKGSYCLRVNPNGVDLNRNWGTHWDPVASEIDPAATNPGTAPFSEPETQIFKRLVSAYNPTTFLAIHAGTFGMYMPWAYNQNGAASRNREQMMHVLRDLDEAYCQCPYGGAGKEVGYPCPGTSLDWVYEELKTPYVYAFEIYTSPKYADGLHERWQQKLRQNATALLQSRSSLAHEHFRDLFSGHPTSFVQRRGNATNYEDLADGWLPEECLELFNPVTQAEYTKTVHNWVAAYLDMADLVVADLRRQDAAAAGANGTSATFR